MDLRTFVSEALVQIQEGVQAAIDRRMETDRNSGAINPQFEPFEEGREALVEKVQFDVAVTVSKGEESSMGGGISVLKLSLDGKKGRSEESGSVSRIQFSVRVIPPLTRVHDQRTRQSRTAYAGDQNDLAGDAI